MDIRVAKFETLIEDINEELINAKLLGGIISAFMGMTPYSAKTGNTETVETKPLDFIFNRDKVNEFAQCIMSKATFELKRKDDYSYSYVNPWEKVYGMKVLNDAKIRIEAAKEFVKCCREEQNGAEGYKLIFWSLMILTVDDSNGTEKLSLICDLAKMLKITDDELMDIIYVIKNIYNECDCDYKIKTDTILTIFGSVLNMYRNVDSM